jgi:DNA invertase Pin-like site-specific DNA recombinase
MNFGYARVSTKAVKGRKAQHVDNQVERLAATGIDREHIYVDDGVSGRKASRPEWDKLLGQLREGDKLTVTSMTRIGRSTKNLLDIMDEFKRRGVDVVFLDQNIDTSSIYGELVFTIFAGLAQFEAAQTRERVLEGLESARDRRPDGVLPTRGATFTEVQRMKAEELARNTRFSAQSIAEMVGVSRATLYRHVDIAALRETAAQQG